MGIKSSGDKTIFSEINITPLTDIFLVLLIIMMVMAPMFQAVDQDIKLPTINSGLSVEENKVTVAVTQKGEYYVNSAPTKLKNLGKALKAVLPKDDKEKIVILKADGDAKTSAIIKVMEEASHAGYAKLTVAGEPLSPGQQEELEKNSAKQDKKKNEKVNKKTT